MRRRRVTGPLTFERVLPRRVPAAWCPLLPALTGDRASGRGRWPRSRSADGAAATGTRSQRPTTRPAASGAPSRASNATSNVRRRQRRGASRRCARLGVADAVRRRRREATASCGALVACRCPSSSAGRSCCLYVEDRSVGRAWPAVLECSEGDRARRTVAAGPRWTTLWSASSRRPRARTVAR